MVLSNFLGTVVINSTLILGIVSLISPLRVYDFSPYIIGILFTLLIASVFAVFSSTDRKISKKEAVVLILIYLIFIAFQFILK
jgi:Ca2+/Na+ antiporter